MASRLLATALLATSAAIAWLAITFTIAARALQAGIAVSIVYVAYLAWRGARTIRAALREAEAPRVPADRPRITVVVPARDEADSLGPLLETLSAQDYADASGPRYDVIVVDDASSDGTGALSRSLAAEHGDLLRVVRREPGAGLPTKGAVLAYAMPFVRGEIVAVLDADARLSPDFLSRAMQAWQRDPSAAALQVRRHERNAGSGWLAAAQEEEQLMDLASQCGRWATDGTAELRGDGMFVRRDALERVGGWDPAALTEDLELSTRLVRGGFHVTLAPEAVASELAVERLSALWPQRLRWAEGSLRRLIDHGPRLVASDLPLVRKLDFLAFLAEFFIPPLFVAAVVASVATVALPGSADWTVPASLFVGYGLGSFVLALAGIAATGERGAAAYGRAARGALFLSHWLVVVPAALLRIAFMPRRIAFARTARPAEPDR